MSDGKTKVLAPQIERMPHPAQGDPLVNIRLTGFAPGQLVTPETGGKNQPGLHWDRICDLRQGQG